MPAGNMLELALALKEKLIAEIPALITEVNATKMPDEEYEIIMPATVELGIRTEMIQREIDELPAMACGIYQRKVLQEGEQEWSYVVMPFIIDVYLGQENADSLYIKAHKWAIVFDLFVERFASALINGYWSDEAPDIDISYALEKRDGTFRQLVSATGIITSAE